MRLVRFLARSILWLEPLVLAGIALAFWYPTPTRTDWLWLLWLLIPILIARYICHQRLMTRTPLDLVFVAFMTLGVINVALAPYTRGLMMLARPLLGIAMYYAFVERVRESDNLRGPVQVMIMLSLLFGVQALGATQWNPKAAPLESIIAVLPVIQGPATRGGFNANEIGGAITWLLPLIAGVGIHRWQTKGIRWDVTLAFLMLFAAILLGQSRSSLAGIIIAFALLAWFLLHRHWRILGWFVVVSIIVLEVLIFADVLLPSDATTGDASSVESNSQQSFVESDSVENRRQIWNSALEITRDYPVLGVGLSMFRDGRVRERYPVPALVDRIVPHAHNEILQILTDMGLLGLGIFLAMHLVVLWMLVQVWKAGDLETRAVGVAVGAGLLAHFIFGFTDAITLWDRFSFVFWMMLGIAGAAYTRAINLRSGQQNLV